MNVCLLSLANCIIVMSVFSFVDSGYTFDTSIFKVALVYTGTQAVVDQETQ